MNVFNGKFLIELTAQAKENTRLRKHYNIHKSYQEPCQRLFNALEIGTYIRPHRHFSEPREELLVAIKGHMALITFSDFGEIVDVILLCAGKVGCDSAVAVDVPPNIWHTVVALEPECVLLEIKSGPFNPDQPKDFPNWSPKEGTTAAENYLAGLNSSIKPHKFCS